MLMMTSIHSGLSLREVEADDWNQTLVNDSDLVGLGDFVDRLESQLTRIPPEIPLGENDCNCLILSFYFRLDNVNPVTIVATTIINRLDSALPETRKQIHF